MLARLSYLLVSAAAVLLVACSGGGESAESSKADSQSPKFDVNAFTDLNPNPEIRDFDPEIDFGFDEHEKIPRDAIEPIYSPKFVSPSEVDLSPDEMVMGLTIDGDSRAYPVGLMRFREMVNDNVGGTPLLVSW